MDPKQRAAEAAMELITNDMVVGLGTGSTAEFFLTALGNALQSGKLRKIRGIPTSKRSEQRAIELGIPITTLSECGKADVTVDGADEVAPNVDVIKGLGGALLREKIVAQNARTMVIIADESKVVTVLGTKSPLPVEVATFEHRAHERFLTQLGSTPVLRKKADGTPFVTDNSNYIYDCRFDRIDDPTAIQQALRSRAGIVDSGLFIGIASIAFIASPNGVRKITRGG